jgi:peptidyl-tRNA hydrolase
MSNNNMNKNSIIKENEYKMFIFVNTDLKMKPGKIAGQVGHVVQAITEEIIRDKYEVSINNSAFIPKIRARCINRYNDYMNWSNSGASKIILQASKKEMLDIMSHENITKHIFDAGKTQIESNSFTVIAFIPMLENKIPYSILNHKLL